jgi:hypothetical protein
VISFQNPHQIIDSTPVLLDLAFLVSIFNCVHQPCAAAGTQRAAREVDRELGKVNHAAEVEAVQL